ncbi:response regulator [Moheibacter sediminis]|uniref:histidine kinase n=1 Tax=Moheibacter sediminis TaxID=1434700 RepID=A0A1W2B099_9FLAO|nr:response regulator [Moheibacter sediminis]SMC66121.1 Signal transduction histidine kinase [Moheibacter sediminis]
MPKQLIKKLQIGFGLCFIILMITSVASYLSVQKQIENRSKVLQTQEMILKADNILIDLLNAETGQRGFYLTNNESFLEPYYKGLESLPKSLAEIKKELPEDSEQSYRMDTISYLVNFRLKILEDVVKTKKSGGSIEIDQLELGKEYMDSCRTIIQEFVASETEKLDRRSHAMNVSSNYTSAFILAACFISLVITFIFYRQLRNEFLKRDELQKELKKKDEQLSKRLTTIQHIAQQIALGDYSVRVQEDEKDSLGGIASALNEMTESLQTSFENINQNEWRQTGLAKINEILAGNKRQDEIAHESLTQLVTYTESMSGAFYILEEESLELKGYFGLEPQMNKKYLPGEGVVGQVFENKIFRSVENISSEDYVMSFAVGQIKLSHMLWMPLMFKEKCFGVIELGANQSFDETGISFLQEACRVITLELMAAKSRARIQTLLEETQAQSEELQMQHSELENLNAELEAQTQLLQASEEELKVQQEELLQSNQELEERSKLLEEKNQLIAFRNQEIQKKAEELAVSTKYKSEFLANMSHELRTPLNSILLLSRLMVENDDENLNEDQIESAKVIQSSGSSLLSLIDEILDLSKIEAGKMELEFEPVNISEICNDLNGMFQPLAKEKGISFQTEISSEISSTIETDKLRLDQVLRNLLANAFKFTQQGEIRLTIDSAPHQKDFIRFSVKDTGIGITEENQQIIFEAFQQADGSTRRKFGGTGLGLSISREIIKLLGGQISVESTLGEGSTFTISIPKNKELIQKENKTILESIAEISIAEEIIQDAASEYKDPFTVDEIPEEIADDRDVIKSGDKVILIVEDDTNFAKSLLKYTRQQNYLGIVLVRGDQVLSFAERYQPLAILLDIQLPVKSGWDVMDDLKKNAKTRHIPVHIMSSLQAKKESLKKGAIDFINKPIALEQMRQIFSKIDEALNRNSQKVLIVEENPKHAAALSIFLNNFNITSEIKSNVEESVNTLLSSKVNCVILDMGLPDKTGYETLEAIKNHEGLEDLPIIIFTGKNLSHAEEIKIKNYADSIVVKTAHSFQRILDEVGLFLHLVEENHLDTKNKSTKISMLGDALTGKTILIADDDVRNIFSLTKILEKYKVNVISAMNGKEALNQLYTHPDVSVVLMDMMMPEMDGYQTIQTIRQNPAYKNLPIISVTAKAMTGDREKCIAAGASDYISKPVDKDQLLSLLRVWLYEI